MTERVSARNEPGTLREYETVLILRPDLSDQEMAGVNQKVAGIIDKHGGKLLRVEAWGRRRLAYEIKKQPKGFYYYWRYLANNALLDDLNHTLRVSEQVLRHLVVKLDENVHPDARPADVEPEALDPTLRRKSKPEETKEAAPAEAKAAPAEAEIGGETAEAGGAEAGTSEQEAGKGEDKGEE